MEKLIVSVMVVCALSLGLAACSQQPTSTPAPPAEEKAAMPEGSEMKPMEEPMEGSEAKPMEGSEAVPLEGSEMKEELSAAIEEGAEIIEEAVEAVEEEAAEVIDEASKVADEAPAALPEVSGIKPMEGSEHK